MPFIVDVIVSGHTATPDLTRGVPFNHQPVEVHFRFDETWDENNMKIASVMFNDRRTHQFLVADNMIRIPGMMVEEGNIKMILYGFNKMDCHTYIDENNDRHYMVSSDPGENPYTRFDGELVHAYMDDSEHKKDSTIFIADNGHFIFTDKIVSGYMDQIDVPDEETEYKPFGVSYATLYERPIQIGSVTHAQQARKADPRARGVYPFSRGRKGDERDRKDPGREGASVNHIRHKRHPHCHDWFEVQDNR